MTLLIFPIILNQQITLGGFNELGDTKRGARIDAGLSPSFEEQNFKPLYHRPSFHLRPASPDSDDSKDSDEDQEIDAETKEVHKKSFKNGAKERDKDIKESVDTSLSGKVDCQNDNEVNLIDNKGILLEESAKRYLENVLLLRPKVRYCLFFVKFMQDKFYLS